MAAPSSAPKGGSAPLLESWLSNARVLHVAHGMAAQRCARITRVIGVLVAVAAAVVGTALFALTLRAPVDDRAVLLGTAIVSAGIAVLGIAQTALNLPELSARHREAFVAYGTLRRQMEILTTGSGRNGGADLDKLSESWSTIEEWAPRPGRLLRFAATRELARAERQHDEDDGED